ncbi:MAG TPA: AMIN domain-containing protein [Blastocatellia bacterium]
MKYKQIPIAVTILLLFLGQGIVKSGNDRERFGEARMIALPPEAILNVHSTPVIASNGDVGFVSSVMTGSLISFSVTSGKILSSVSFGEIAGLVSMIESGKGRLIALPTANDPENARPATVNIINATIADRPEKVATIELPADAQIGPDTQALLTADGRFGVIASSFNQPTVFSFSTESGKIISSLKLSGWPSGIALNDGKKNRKDSLVAVVSVEANTLEIMSLDAKGRLSAGKSFNPIGMSLDVSNNPAFSDDGKIVYIAVYTGEHLFSIDTQKGNILGMIKLPSAPQRITIARENAGNDLIGVTRTMHSKKSGGVTILASNRGLLTVRTEFTLPDNIQLSRANNIVFDQDSTMAFLGSADGFLFAFDTKKGELDGHKIIGNEFRSLALSKAAGKLIGVRSTPKNDEIAIVGLDRADLGRVEMQASPGSAPEIKRVSGDPAQIHLVIEGSSFNKSAIVEFIKGGNVVFRQTPIIITEKKLAIVVPAKKVEALGRFELRVVANDKVLSNAVTIDPAALLSGINVNAVPVKTDRPLRVTTKIESVSKPAAPRTATVLHSVRAQVSDGLLRILVDVNGDAKFRDFVLSDPSRIVLDFVGLRNAFGNRTIPVGKGLVDRVRIGQPMPGVVRVVIDTKETVQYRVTQEAGSLIIAIGNVAPKATAGVAPVR